MQAPAPAIPPASHAPALRYGSELTSLLLTLPLLGIPPTDYRFVMGRLMSPAAPFISIGLPGFRYPQEYGLTLRWKGLGGGSLHRAPELADGARRPSRCTFDHAPGCLRHR